MQQSRKIRALLVGAAFSILFLWLALRSVDFRETGLRLQQLDACYLLLPLAMTALNFPLRGWRWQRIFPPHVRPGFWSCFQVLLMGNAINNILPGRGGDVARCLLVSRNVSLAGGSLALATLGIEKILDGVALLVVVLCSCWFLSPPHWMWQLGIGSAVVLGVAIAALYILQYRSEWCLACLRALFRQCGLRVVGEKVVQLGSAFAGGLHVISSPLQMSGLLLITAAIWTTEVILIYALGRALHLHVPISAALVTCAVLGLGLMIPAAPGSIGTYEFFSVAPMKLMGLAAANALALTLVLHAWVLITTTAAGFIFGGSAMMLRQLRASSAPMVSAEIAVAGSRK